MSVPLFDAFAVCSVTINTRDEVGAFGAEPRFTWTLVKPSAAVSPLSVALVLWFGGSWGRLWLLVVVEYFANSPTCAFGDFACALCGADADVLAGNGSAFPDIASGVEGVKRDKVARTFPNTLGRRSSAFGGSFTDVSGASTDVATWATLMGLLHGGRLRCAGMLRRGLDLAILPASVLAADGKCESEQRDEWFWECSAHRLTLPPG